MAIVLLNPYEQRACKITSDGAELRISTTIQHQYQGRAQKPSARRPGGVAFYLMHRSSPSPHGRTGTIRSQVFAATNHRTFHIPTAKC